MFGKKRTRKEERGKEEKKRKKQRRIFHSGRCGLKGKRKGKERKRGGERGNIGGEGRSQRGQRIADRDREKNQKISRSHRTDKRRRYRKSGEGQGNNIEDKEER